MDARYTVIIAALVGWAGYVIGHDAGQESCPEMADYRTDQDAALEAEMAQIEADFASTPTGRDAICDRVFDMVRDGLDEEAMDEQAERARQPDH